MPDGANTVADLGNPVERWQEELASYDRMAEQWTRDARRISNRYTLYDRQRREVSPNSKWSQAPEFNILWSNIQTMKPALFARQPVPVVERRHRDTDPVARLAGQVLERALVHELEDDPFLEVFQRITQDVLLTARGVPWIRYEPDIRQVPVERGPNDDDDNNNDGDTEERIAAQTVPTDYVHWGDFAHAPLPTWTDIQRNGWVARKVMMTRREGTQRFGDVFAQVPLSYMPTNEPQDKDRAERLKPVLGMAEVWEIWDAVDRKAIWICKEYKDGPLDERDDPLGLERFFPCPQPAYGTLGNDSLTPVPDYLQYEKLAKELDDQTQRIGVLQRALRVRGVYDASMPALGKLLSDVGSENNMVGVDNLLQFLSRGSTGSTINNVMQFFPLETVAQALVQLYDARENTKQILYEVSGLSDILRGAVDPREKLGQSRLKGQFASQRLEQRRMTVERCARDALRIKAEIMCEHFTPDVLREMSGYDQLPEVMRMQEQPGLADQVFAQCIDILRSDKLRGYRLDIETDSTVALDAQEDQQRRTEFLTAAGSFLEQMLPVAQAVPQMTPLAMDMLTFGVRGFRVGRTLEARFEETAQKLRDAAEQAEGQAEQPSPEAQAEQAKAQAAQQKAETDMAIGQQKAQAEAQKAQMGVAATQAKAEAEIAKVQADAQLTALQMQAKIVELEANMAAMQQKLQMEQESARMKANAAARDPASE